MTTTELQAFISDHHGHELSFEAQEFIECLDCEETFELPEGSGVRILENEDVVIEVPSGTVTYRGGIPHHGTVRYYLDMRSGAVSI